MTSSSHQTSKIGPLRQNLQKSKHQFQYIVYLLDAQKTLIYQKFTSDWSRLSKRWSGVILVHLSNPFGPLNLKR